MTADHTDEKESARLEANASGDARIYQAVGDQHIEHHEHYGHGVRRTRRVTANVIDDDCPYPTGMASFRLEDAQWFFGRDQLASELVGRLDQRFQSGGGPLMVVAASGAGKSSVLQAGLLPRLEQGSLPGSRRWPRLVLTPTKHPVSAVTAAIAAGVDADIADETTAQLVAEDPVAYIEALRQHRLSLHSAEDGTSWRLVIIIDQLEELFTMCEDKEERVHFLELVEQLTTPGSHGQEPLALVVYGLRSDFYAQCADHPHLRVALQDGHVMVGPMSPDGLRQAIVNPAERARLRIDPGLVDLMLRDLGVGAGDTNGYEAGRLPLLAHALRATWRERHGDTLTVDAYTTTGGIEHAVATSANDVFNTLDAQEQKTARAVFLRLVKIGDSFDDVRRRMYRADLLSGSEKDQKRVSNVLKAFTEGRLLTQQQETVEITHEVLLRAWPLLRGWIESDRAGQLIRQRLEEAAESWDREGRHPDALYRGPRLVEAREWNDVTGPDAGLSPLGREFLTQSIRDDQARQRDVRRRTKRLRRLIVLLATLLVLAVVTTVVAVIALRVAQNRADNALANMAAGVAIDPQTGTAVGAQLALAAYHVNADEEGPRGALISRFTQPYMTPIIGHKNDIKSGVFSSDGRILASASSDGSTRLWDVTNTHQPASLTALTDLRGGVNTVAFNPDSKIVSIGSDDRAVRLLDITDPRQPVRLSTITDHQDAVLSIKFSPDGRMLVGSGQDGTIRLWNISNPRQPIPLATITDNRGSVNSVAYSPDGHTLAGASQDSTIRLWNISNPRQPIPLATITDNRGSVNSVAYSPDGHTLATTDDNRTRLWNVTNPYKPGLLSDFSSQIGTVRFAAFHPDGHTLASGGTDRTIRLIDLSGPVARHHTDVVYSVAFSPDGNTAATGSWDSTIHLWNVRNRDQPIPLAPLLGHTAPVKPVAFSPDGRILASGSDDKTVRLWDVINPHQPKALATLTGHSHFVATLAFSPDGRTLVSAGDDKTIRLWDVTNPRQASPSSTIYGHEEVVLSVAFSPNNHTIASVSQDRTTRLWDVTNRYDPVPLKVLRSNLATVSAVAFHPDGRMLATGSFDHTVHLWDVANPRAPKLFSSPIDAHNGVSSLAFSPDGHELVSGQGNELRIWSISDPENPREMAYLPGHSSPVQSMAFNSDGHTIISGSWDHTALIWETDIDHIAQRICETTTHADPDAEALWNRKFPNDSYKSPCQN